MRGPARRDAGFTYLGLLILVTIVGLVGAATLKVDALLRRAAAERELLAIGAAFGDALRSYADATPRGQPQQPASLQDLLKDPRFPGVRRHLRKIFVDPMTGKAEWGIVYTGGVNGGGGRVLAVYSLSQARPLKLTHFDARFQNLDNKDYISDWKFAATGQAPLSAMPPPVPALAGSAPGQPSLFAAPSPVPVTTAPVTAPGAAQDVGQDAGQAAGKNAWQDAGQAAVEPASLFAERDAHPAAAAASAPAAPAPVASDTLAAPADPHAVGGPAQPAQATTEESRAQPADAPADPRPSGDTSGAAADRSGEDNSQDSADRRR